MNMKPLISSVFALCFVCLILFGCQAPDSASSEASASAELLSKLEVDLSDVDNHGLRGPADGKRAVAYEFAIPDTATHREEVRSIDPTVQFMAGSRGRIGAGKDECLCIGSTHQNDFRSVLRSLSELPYVERIIECYFE